MWFSCLLVFESREKNYWFEKERGVLLILRNDSAQPPPNDNFTQATVLGASSFVGLLRRE